MHIRKISIGVDYTRGMHFVVGQSLFEGKYILHLIEPSEKGGYKIWIKGEGELLLWKELLPTLPITVEFNINF